MVAPACLSASRLRAPCGVFSIVHKVATTTTSAAFGVHGNDQELSNREVLAWMRDLDAEQPFRLTACRFDTLGIEFGKPVRAPHKLARRMLKFCQDLDGSFETARDLATHLREKQAVTFWWD